MFTLIIPCYNEENYIADCLAAVAGQTGLPESHDIQIIVAANACRDRTVDIARQMVSTLNAKGFRVDVLDIEQAGKINALNEAEAIALFGNRAYLDADVVISSTLLAELGLALERADPVYVGATVRIPSSASWVTRAYARVWSQLPFVRKGISGIGFYAVNAAGRTHWTSFPSIYSDDRFVRMNFTPQERVKLTSTYDWPLPDGFFRMVHVRRRWCEGNNELLRMYPQLVANDKLRHDTSGNAISLLKTPISSAVFVAIYATGWALAKLRPSGAAFHWRRGRS